MRCALLLLVVAGAALAPRAAADDEGPVQPSAPVAERTEMHPVDCLITSRPFTTARCEAP